MTRLSNRRSDHRSATFLPPQDHQHGGVSAATTVGASRGSESSRWETEEGPMSASRTSAVAACVAMLSLLSSWLPAQAAWSTTPVTGAMPCRSEHAAVYDMAREQMFVFGGLDAAWSATATTSAFDGVHWQQLASAVAPPARAGHAMAYDFVRQRVVLFGGYAAVLGPYLDDTWEFDGSSWSELQPATRPSGRSDHAMAHDVASQQVLMFGGRPNLIGVLGDTWGWNGIDWQPLATSAAAPTARRAHAMSSDFTRGRVVLFGGFDGHSRGDTWEWDGAAWNERTLASPAPAPRVAHAMAYDFHRGVSVMQGGLIGGDETWEWDGNGWTLQASTVRERIENVLVYDARLQRVTRQGGFETGAQAVLAEVDSYGGTVAGAWVAHGQGCAGSTATPQLVAPATAVPGPMIGNVSVVQARQTWHHTFFAFGWSATFDGSTPLPLDLAAFGMPGCMLQVSRDAITSVMPVNGTATLAIPLPNDPFLVGEVFHVQALALDPGANLGGFTTTNRLTATVGRF